VRPQRPISLFPRPLLNSDLVARIQQRDMFHFFIRAQQQHQVCLKNKVSVCVREREREIEREREREREMRRSAMRFAKLECIISYWVECENGKPQVFPVQCIHHLLYHYILSSEPAWSHFCDRLFESRSTCDLHGMRQKILSHVPMMSAWVRKRCFIASFSLPDKSFMDQSICRFDY
jgi:hypothetical protein